MLTPPTATVVDTNGNLPRVSVSRFEDDGRLDDHASFRPRLGGGRAPAPASRDDGGFGGIFYTSREAIAQHPDALRRGGAARNLTACH